MRFSFPVPVKTFFLLFLTGFWLSGCLEVALPPLKPLPELDRTAQKKLIQEWEKSGPPVYQSTISPTPLPSKERLIPPVGKENVYGIPVTPELKLAFETYLGGDLEQALKALEQAEAKPNDAGMSWQISFLKAQILIMMGRAADAENELETTSKREIAFIGHNWNARALRGEIKLWLEDYEEAKRDLFQVVRAAGNWSMPTSYALPPSNLPQLVGVTTAQLRAFTALAGIYVFQEKFEKALQWAQEAEKKFNDVHHVTRHPLYGRSVVAFADSFYGRANNLAFLASAKLAVTKDIAESDRIFDQARAFFLTLDYNSGLVTVEALKARTLYLIGQDDLSLQSAKKAVELARQYGVTDLIWRIEALRGQILFNMGREKEAEEALRNAQNSIDIISGTLTTDRAKVRFGVGKEDVAYYLTRIDLKKQDFPRLFEDLERSRSRAFVEMLAARKIAQNREPELVAAIQRLDQQIHKQRLINFAPGDSPLKSPVREQELQSQRQAAIERLRQKDPELADVLSISSKSLRQIQDSLKTGELLVYPIPGRSTEPIRLFLVEAQGHRMLGLTLTWKDLQAQLDRFSLSIGLPIRDQTKRGVAVKRFPSTGPSADSTGSILKNLGERLRFSLWSASKTIYVVPSGGFYFVPWGALDIQTPVVVLPNGGWLIRHPYSFVSQSEAGIIGDPEFGGDLPQLPGARLEAERIASHYRVTPLLREKATEEGLRQAIGSGVNILHLATHGIFNAKDPLASALFLTKDKKAFPLTAYSLYERPLPARFVIMSACETGMGHITSGDDLLGLSRSFYLSGTLGILSSLWPIDDQGTKLFMEVFHRNLLKGDYGTAWLAARNTLKEQGVPAYIYGAYILGGSR